MSPEVIEHRAYGSPVDVYSFAITLWELLSGKVPYAHLTPLQAAVGVVQKGLRPDVPPGCPLDLYKLLEDCWHGDPEMRPDFSSVTQRMQQMYKTLSKGQPVDLSELTMTAAQQASAAAAEKAKVEKKPEKSKTAFFSFSRRSQSSKS
jgi:serine/threonine protein kinase